MATSPSSSADAARKALGNELRRIRLAAGLSTVALAQRTGAVCGRAWHRTKVSKLEHGVTAPTPEDIRVWCGLCGVPERAEGLIEERNAVAIAYIEYRGMKRAGMRRLQQSFVGLWQRTSRFSIYEPMVIPGVFQTEAYARAVLSALIVMGRLPDDLDAAVEVRIARQSVLDGTRTFDVVLEEQALYTRFGSGEVMAAQLERLLDVGRLPGVGVGVIPATAVRDPAWPVNGFWIYDGRTVITEIPTAQITVTHEADVETFSRLFSGLTRMARTGAAVETMIGAAIEVHRRN